MLGSAQLIKQMFICKRVALIKSVYDYLYVVISSYTSKCLAKKSSNYTEAAFINDVTSCTE